MRLGSLCTGYGGLEMAAQTLFDAELAWVADNDSAVTTLLEERMPGIPNYGDITKASPPSVDILTAGFPCQPISGAGRRKGTEDDRWLWPAIEALVGRMEPRPRLLLFENVPGLLTINDGNAMGDVVQGLAGLGFVGRYRLLQASDLGACHRRRRWFCVATNTSSQRRWPQPGGTPGKQTGPGTLRRVDEDTDHQPDSLGKGGLLPTPNAWDGARGPDYARQRDRRATGSGGDDLTTTVAKLLPTPTVSRGRNKTATRQADSEHKDGTTLLDVKSADTWGQYAAAVERHARLVDAPPPSPVDAKNKLSPAFVEWMMTLPPGWVTELDLPRTTQLKMLGNGVLPIQAETAYRSLLNG